ncbi:hypothetical protein AVEN_224204-1 [Araneus ventricosus]|uniref:Uncharacterized protein n=1 Tax=Araneus ventricosus TaxID=182803 RepID=A0A4Y2EH58_ARAVE|nr:hypothetical protein AVEN_224204-1 [Araneus ventricosus]
MLSANTGSKKKRPFLVLSSVFGIQTNTMEGRTPSVYFSSHLPFLFLNTLPSKAREWFLSCLLVIRPQVGQITQPQSCAFLHGVDWMWSVLTGGLCRLKRGWSA